MSRFAGVWVGLKCVKDNIEQTGDRRRLARAASSRSSPPISSCREGGLNIRLARYRARQGGAAPRLQAPGRRSPSPAPTGSTASSSPAAARRASASSPPARAIRTSAEALDLLGIDEVRAADLGLRLYKVGMPWPLEPEGVQAFAEGLDLIMVVEEKRALIEVQIKEHLYNGRDAARRSSARSTRHGEWLFPAKGALEPVQIALAHRRRIVERADAPDIRARIAELEAAERQAGASHSAHAERIPYFCAGCPHNTSTVVPEGSRAYAGIGCHFMAQWMDRVDRGLHPDGRRRRELDRRGAVHQARPRLPESRRRHLSSIPAVLAIRAAVASGVNITYKLLYNDAVAMTGGQPLDGGMTRRADGRSARGRRRQAHRRRLRRAGEVSAGGASRRRDHLATATISTQVQRELRETPASPRSIYDQTCAAEKRRRRKRGTFPDPDQARLHQRAGLRGLRRLRRAVQLRRHRAGGDRVRPQARHRPVDLQQGLLLRQGLLPELRHRPWRPARKPKRAGRPNAAPSPILPEPPLPALDAALLHGR